MLSSFSIGYDGIGKDLAITMRQSTLTKGTDENKPCKVSANDTVALCADGDRIHGVIGTIDKEVCSVNLRGIFSIPYTGSAPTVGISKLLANGSGGVKVDAGGDEFRVVHVDTTNTMVYFYFV